jgi:hypothetical protein
MRYVPAGPFSIDPGWQPGLQTSGNGDQREILASLYDVDTARQMIAVLAKMKI